MNTLTLILLALGLAIIAFLASYAFSLHKQVKQAVAQQTATEKQAAEILRQHQQELIKDIRFLVRAVLAEQCEITEGVLRIQYLVEKLDPDVWAVDELNATRAHYQATQDMPILDAYKTLNKQQQFKVDNQRYTLENENKDVIFKELQWLLGHDFPAVSLLH